MPERDLLVLSEDPLNAETRLERQRGTIVRAGHHYVRTHFGVPLAPRELLLNAPSQASRSVTLEEIRSLQARTLPVTLECAGNGRRFLEPPVPGEQWGLGAVGTAEWTGVPLHSVLDGAWPSDAAEVLFRGADEGTPKDLGRPIAYERSLPIDVARWDDVLLAYAMNGEPIPPEHGGPIRLIVPSWYGMASVKWLAELTFLERPFEGFFQKDRYVMDGRPLRKIEPRAVIASPEDGARVPGPSVEVRGFAWSGRAPLQRIELIEGGRSLASNVASSAAVGVWQEFAFRISLAPGDHILVARARDEEGEQPLSANWNALGYANNGARPVRISVRG